MNSMRLRPRAPPGTGKPGAVANRDNVHSGKRFGIRVKAVRSAFPYEGKVSAEPTDEV